MTIIANQPIVMKDCELLIEADDYTAHVSRVRFDPSSSTVTWKGLTPSAKFTDTTSPEWTCSLAYAQDWATDDSLSRYLHEHAGETVTAKFQPKKGSGLPQVTADITLAPGPIGGDVDAVMTGEVTLGVDGEPALGEAA